MRSLPAAAALTLAIASPAAADDYQPDRVLPAASFADLKAIVTALGHTIEAEDAKNQTLRAADAKGTHYLLTGTACDIDGVPGCRGIVMQALFTIAGPVSDERLAQANLDQVAVSTRFFPEKGVVSVTRYEVLDGGVTMMNIGENVGVLLALAPAVLSILEAK